MVKLAEVKYTKRNKLVGGNQVIKWKIIYTLVIK